MSEAVGEAGSQAASGAVGEAASGAVGEAASESAASESAASESAAPVGAIVLAGGRSSRFGRDKLAEPVDGRPLLRHALEAVRAVAGTVVVVASPTGAPNGSTGPFELPAGVLVAHDPRPFEGPLAGLAAGLAALPTGIDRVLVVGGDMPSLVIAVLGRMLRGLETRACVVLADGSHPRPLPMAVRSAPASAAAERLLARGERRLRALLPELDAEVIAAAVWRLDDPRGATLRDVDLPKDL